ncbi:MAG: hypothetical protein OZ948_13650 [Deltaproteobacteria bacterium]|nr:hypothetical protein [Deltaproteobacteria bacterium]
MSGVRTLGPASPARRLVLCVLLASFAVAALPAIAGAQAPFGHACTAQEGVRFCPTVELADRVPSWDGTPIDVDVTIPAQRPGPYPAIVMIHGWGTNKTQYEATSPGGYDNLSFARRGYLVVNLSMRGFGRSCGRYENADTSTSPGCTKGWLHLADPRYEARDVQYLLGLLADEGLIRGPVATTGGSYGGATSLELAYLRDRIRLPDGSFRRWRSPGGHPMRIAAAWAIAPYSDLVSALAPNGRFLSDRPWTGWLSRFPIGVPQKSVTSGLYLAGLFTAFLAPVGVDPSADITTWYGAIMAGEPWPAEMAGYVNEVYRHHGAFSIPDAHPAPMLLQSGWTDDVFPPRESLRPYVTLRQRFGPGVPVSLQLGDVGHSRGSNRVEASTYLRDEGVAFIDHWMRGTRGGPKPGAVTAFAQTCPPDPEAGPFHARSWERLANGSIGFGARASRTIVSTGGDPALGQAFDPVFGTQDACKTVAAEIAPGTATYDRESPGVLMLGLPEVEARIRTDGDGGMIAARLWDVMPNGQMRLVSRGVYRLLEDQCGWIRFQLNGNGYRFPIGHTIRMELAPNDADHYRKSNLAFRVEVSHVRITLPTRSGSSTLPARRGGAHGGSRPHAGSPWGRSR